VSADSRRRATASELEQGPGAAVGGWPRDAVGKARKQLGWTTPRAAGLDARLTELQKSLDEVLAEHPTTLVEIDGLATITAAKILAEVGDVRQFRCGPTSPATPAPHRSTCSPERTTATGPTERATAGSTTCCTSRSIPKAALPVPGRTITGASARPAEPPRSAALPHWGTIDVATGSDAWPWLLGRVGGWPRCRTAWTASLSATTPGTPRPPRD
jgi:hypothetical protein